MSGTCTIDGCGKPTIARGWCSMHYSRWKRYGDVHRGRLRNYCSVPDCDVRAHGEGYCAVHYWRWRRHGDPLGGRMEIPEGPVEIPLRDSDGNVVAVTLVDGIDSLWLTRWSWSLSPSGYAYRVADNKTVLMARLLLGLLDAPPEFQVDHINRVRLDNRRSNLRVVSAEQNSANRGGAYERSGEAAS